MRRIFETYKKILWKTNKILDSLYQISEKFVGNFWLIFLQFEKFSVIRVSHTITWRKLKKKICERIWISFVESLEIFEKILIKSFESFQEILQMFKN